MVDEIDERIIGLLKENSRMTYVDIGNGVGLSEGAVRNRVQSLVSSGVIRRFTVEVTPSMRVRALVMIGVRHRERRLISHHRGNQSVHRGYQEDRRGGQDEHRHSAAYYLNGYPMIFPIFFPLSISKTTINFRNLY
jgi:DNA-binding Lrp family transcriptional regulator